MADVRGHDPPFGTLRRQISVREGAAYVYSDSESGGLVILLYK